MKILIQTLLFSILITLAQRPVSAQISPLWDNFVEAKEKGETPTLPDFSYAGYAFMQEPIPDVEGPVFDITDYGAVPNDGKSDQQAIQAAIHAAENAGGGVVFFPKGRYLVNTNDDPGGIENIKIAGHGIVLRGEGNRPGGTEIVMVNYLEEQTPGEKWTVPFMFEWVQGAQSWDNWGRLTASVSRESMCIQVDEIKPGIKPGALIMLRLKIKNKAHKDFFIAPYTHDEEWANHWNLNVPHEVASVDEAANEICFKEPIHLDIDINQPYNEGDDAWRLRPYLPWEKAGVKDIRFIGNWKDEFVHHQDYIHDGGWSAVSMSGVKDGWIRRCTFVNMNRSIDIGNSFRMSVLDVEITGNGGHHSVQTNQGYGNLVGLVKETANNWHGTSIAHGAEGHVRWHVQNSEAILDAHGNGPHASLLDDSQGGCAMRDGGATTNLPNHFGEFVLWNYKSNQAKSDVSYWDKSERAFYAHPIIVGIHGEPVTYDESTLALLESPGTPVEPQSLFEAQVKLRLGSVPAWLTEMKENFDARPDWDSLATYTLAHPTDPDYLATAGANQIMLQPEDTASMQKWHLVHVEEEQYLIKNVASGLCLFSTADAGNGERVTVGENNGSDDYRWQVVHAGKSHFQLKNVANGKSLTTTGEDSPLTVSVWNGQEYQKWKLWEQSAHAPAPPSTVTSLDELSAHRRFSVYPNPVQGELIWEWHAGSEKEADVFLRNLQGRKVKHSRFPLAPGNNTFTINVRGLGPGVYILTTQVGGSLYHKKLIIN